MLPRATNVTLGEAAAAASRSFVLATLRALHLDPAAAGQQSGSDPRERPLPGQASGTLTAVKHRAQHRLAATATGPDRSYVTGEPAVPTHWRTTLGRCVSNTRVPRIGDDDVVA